MQEKIKVKEFFDLALSGNVEDVKSFLKKNPGFDVKAFEDENSFFSIIHKIIGKFSLEEVTDEQRDNLYTIIELIIDKDPKVIDVKNEQGENAFLFLVSMQHYGLAAKLLSSEKLTNEQIDCVDKLNQGVLHKIAASKTKNEKDNTLVATLISTGCDINLVDSNGNTPAMIAAMSGKYNILDLLIDKGGLFFYSDEEGIDYNAFAKLPDGKEKDDYLKEKIKDSLEVIKAKNEFLEKGSKEKAKIVRDAVIDAAQKATNNDLALHIFIKCFNAKGINVFDALVKREDCKDFLQNLTRFLFYASAFIIDNESFDKHDKIKEFRILLKSKRSPRKIMDDVAKKLFKSLMLYGEKAFVRDAICIAFEYDSININGLAAQIAEDAISTKNKEVVGDLVSLSFKSGDYESLKEKALKKGYTEEYCKYTYRMGGWFQRKVVEYCSINPNYSKFEFILSCKITLNLNAALVQVLARESLDSDASQNEIKTEFTEALLNRGASYKRAAIEAFCLYGIYMFQKILKLGKLDANCFSISDSAELISEAERKFYSNKAHYLESTEYIYEFFGIEKENQVTTEYKQEYEKKAKQQIEVEEKAKEIKERRSLEQKDSVYRLLNTVGVVKGSKLQDGKLKYTFDYVNVAKTAVIALFYSVVAVVLYKSPVIVQQVVSAVHNAEDTFLKLAR